MDNRLFYDETTEEFYDERKIRRQDFTENVSDLLNNKEDIINNFITVESVCECIINSLRADIKDVIKDLNENWGYNIEIYVKEK